MTWEVTVDDVVKQLHDGRTVDLEVQPGTERFLTTVRAMCEVKGIEYTETEGTGNIFTLRPIAKVSQ